MSDLHSDPPPGRSRTALLITAVVILVAAAVIGKVLFRRPAPASAGGGEEKKGIAEAVVVPAESRTMREIIELLGITEPEPNTSSAVSAVVTARIMRLPVREGESVLQGQVVALLDPGESPAQIAQARAQVNSALADARQALAAVDQERIKVANTIRQSVSALESARAQEKRAENELQALKGSSKADVAKAKASLDAARRELDRAKAGLRPQEVAAAKAELAQAEAQRDQAKSQANRAKRLLDEQVYSPKQYEEAATAARVAEGQYQAALQKAKLAEEGTRKEDIAVAEAHVREAESGVQSAQSGIFNVAGKEQELAAAKSLVDSARAALDQARAGSRDVSMRVEQSRKAEAQLTQARATLQQAEARNRYLTLTAPVGGVVTRRAANEGDTAQAGAVLLEIGKPGRVRFKVSAAATKLRSLVEGQSAEIQFDSLGGRSLSARVSAVGQSADSSGSGLAWLSIQGAGGLRPGMSGVARVTVGVQKNAVAVPASSVIEEESADTVVVVDKDDTAKRVPVELGIRDADWVQVRKGVKPGDRVATVGAFEIENGAKVKPIAPEQKKP